MIYCKEVALIYVVVFSCSLMVCIPSQSATFGKGSGAPAQATAGQINCSTFRHTAEKTGDKCFGDEGIVIRVGFFENNIYQPLYHSCFHEGRLEVLYVWFVQNAASVGAHQTDVKRSTWNSGGFFPGIPIKDLYTKTEQRAAIAAVVGNTSAANYVRDTNYYLARGHLAAKVDFVTAIEQCATFYLINVAPQWQLINRGNWYTLELNHRSRIGALGYNTTVYTGTYGVLQLLNQKNKLVDIYLYRYGNKTQLPVPRYYYKVLYEPIKKLGTAFVTINSPYYTLKEVRDLTFCTNLCGNNSQFSNWLKWEADRIEIGYSFCCAVDDFRRTVTHLPDFTVKGLFT